MSLKPFISLAEDVETETVIKKSRFLCVLKSIETEADAAAALAAVKKKHYNATHHCSAFITRDGIERASDDGEPQGTAGIPILEALRHSGISGVIAVVTRYFGGTLLGAGGLVRAYSGAVAQALGLAKKTENIPAVTFKVRVPYADYGKLMSVAAEFGAVVSAEFLQDVEAEAVLKAEQQAAFLERMKDAFMGADVCEWCGECYIKQPCVL